MRGESCPSLDRLSAGPLGRVVRLLAGLNLTSVLLARDEQRRTCFVGGPTADSVALLIRRLLGDRPFDSSAGGVPDSVAGQASHLSRFAAIRSGWIENGVDQLVDGLHRRGLSFVLGWALPGECEVRLDRTLRADNGKIYAWLRGFLSERLGVSVSGERDRRRTMEAAIHV